MCPLAGTDHVHHRIAGKDYRHHVLAGDQTACRTVPIVPCPDRLTDRQARGTMNPSARPTHELGAQQ